MNEKKALETLEAFLSMASAETPEGQIAIRDAANSLQYLKNWCLISSEMGQKSTIDGNLHN